MLVILLCCIIKIVQFSTRKAFTASGHPFEKTAKRYVRRRDPNMAEVLGRRESPDSDWNSNHPDSSSYQSNASSQDIDFIQDNSDYQWFLDYGYRDAGTNQHTSILSLSGSYGANDVTYYHDLAKNMDANLAEADMESFRTEDIHALLTNLPPMCTEHLSQENNHLGECYASVSGSMMTKFDLDSSISPHTSSHGEDSENSTSMSICKSELLFSPVKEIAVPGVNFSVDSLDCDFHDMMLTCQANKDNYTIAFEGSVTMYSDSDYHDIDKSVNFRTIESSQWPSKNLKQQMDILKNVNASMTQSDSSSFTTWSTLKKRNSDDRLRRTPSGNNNNSGDDASHLGLTEISNKSRSMPNLYKRRLNNRSVGNFYVNSSQDNLSDTCTVRRRPVKVFDIQHQIYSCNGSGSLSDMATSVDATSASENTGGKHQANFSLFKLFLKQKSISTEGMSTTMDQLSSAENWPGSQSGESNYSDSRGPDYIKHLELSDQKQNEGSIRTYELIAEEPEDENSCGESIEIKPQVESEEKYLLNNLNNNNSLTDHGGPKLSSLKKSRLINNDLMNRSIQTSNFSEINNLKNAHKTGQFQTNAPIKIVEPSFLNKLKKESGDAQKPVYVLYPNYVLPNLDFLNNKDDCYSKVLLIPQKAAKISNPIKAKPFSCNDLELLKRKGLNHVQDWDSLHFLLPQEYRKILSDLPNVLGHINENTLLKDRKNYIKRRSCEFSNQPILSSGSSTATQPSSGYRGSSSILDDDLQSSPASTTKHLNPFFFHRSANATDSDAKLMTNDKHNTKEYAQPSCGTLLQGDVIPPRPPLPRSILRKAESIRRYNLYKNTSEEDFQELSTTCKRKSLPIYYTPTTNRFSETDDEGVDAGASSSSLDEQQEFNNKFDILLPKICNDELAQLDEFFKLSLENEDKNDDSLMQLRSYVFKFLSLKINQDGAEHFGGKKTVSFVEKMSALPKDLEDRVLVAPPNNSPNVSAYINQKHYPLNMPVCDETATSQQYCSSQTRLFHCHHKDLKENNLLQKKPLVDAVVVSTSQLIQHFSNAYNQIELNGFSDSNLNPACAKLALTTLCPALYAVLSDGLKPSIETSFGAINNSVWQIVEASAQQGPLTKALNDLVLRINSEDFITEGLLKFNAFVLGLLNVRSLDAWVGYLRTRETVLKKHYTADSLLVLSLTGSCNVRHLLDNLIATLEPLALLPFHMDFLYEYRQLHLSFKRMDFYHHPVSPSDKQCASTKVSLSHSNRSNSESEEISDATIIRNCQLQDELLTNIFSSSTISSAKANTIFRERPRSCIEPGLLTRANFTLDQDVTSVANKRWSGIAMNSKLYQAYDKLAKEDEGYTDSLENPINMDDRSEKEQTRWMQHEEPESLDSNFSEEKPLNGRRFKKLQQKWEMLSNKESTNSPPLSPVHTPNKVCSKIPRLITSPVKPSGIPVLVSPTIKGNIKKPIIGVGAATTFNTTVRLTNSKNPPFKRVGLTTTTTRSSRADRVDNTENSRHLPRPSSLPYKATPQNGKQSKILPPRRAVSSSLNRKPTSSRKPIPKVVRTLSHRLPSESGHLSYNEDEQLRVVLEVDENWLLCCRGTQKGLVPRSAVIADFSRF